MGKCGICTLKSLIFLQCILIWVASGLLYYVGIVIFKNYNEGSKIAEVSIGESSLVLTPAVLVITCASILFIIGLIGICAALCRQKCLLGTFFVLLLLVVLLEVVAAVVAGAYSGLVYDKIDDWAHDSIDDYYTSGQNETRNDLDFIQEKVHCCGAESYTDWFLSNSTANMTVLSTIPESCCKDKSNCTRPATAVEDSGSIYTEGCIAVLKGDINKYRDYIIGFAVALAVIQLIGLIATCVLCVKKKDPYESIGGDNYA